MNFSMIEDFISAFGDLAVPAAASQMSLKQV